MLPNGWKVCRLGDLIEEYREKSVVQDQFEVFTSSRYGLIPQAEYYGEGRILSRNNVGFHVIPPGYMTYRSRSDNGNFFININDLGRTGIISHFYPVFRFKDGDDKFFLDFLNFKRSELGARSVGSSQKVLSLNALREMRFVLPSLAERQRIAEILSTWDEAVEKVEQLIANTSDQKKALMQQLLTGKKRLRGFRDRWMPTALGDLGSFRKGKGISRADTVAEGIPCIRYGEIYTHHHDVIRDFVSFISQETAQDSERITYGDILFTCSGETAEEIGKCVAYLDDGEAFAGGDIIIFSSQNDDPAFLAYLLNSHPLATQKAQFGQGNSVVHISAANLAKLKFMRPSLEEQRAIGGLLLAADDEIRTLETQRSLLAREKDALMQQLLTGKRRVKLGRKEAA